MPAPPAGVPQLQPAPGTGGEIGVPYNEYFNYSSNVHRSYSPGYTPHLTSLFENPREYPVALCVMATPYIRYAGIHGWFFGSPRGYQSSVPPGSHALAYYQGDLGITTNLRYGHPHGLRVVEPVIIPLNSYAERGGVLITGGGLGTAEVSQALPDAAAPAPVPTPGPMGPAMPTPLPAPTLDK